jgi:hypothetical protein
MEEKKDYADSDVLPRPLHRSAAVGVALPGARIHIHLLVTMLEAGYAI